MLSVKEDMLHKYIKTALHQSGHEVLFIYDNISVQQSNRACITTLHLIISATKTLDTHVNGEIQTAFYRDLQGVKLLIRNSLSYQERPQV